MTVLLPNYCKHLRLMCLRREMIKSPFYSRITATVVCALPDHLGAFSKVFGITKVNWWAKGVFIFYQRNLAEKHYLSYSRNFRADRTANQFTLNRLVGTLLEDVINWSRHTHKYSDCSLVQSTSSHYLQLYFSHHHLPRPSIHPNCSEITFKYGNKTSYNDTTTTPSRQLCKRKL